MSSNTNTDHVSWLPEIAANHQPPADETLVVGDLQRWTAEGRTYSGLDEFNFVSIAALDAVLLARLNPGIILSPLVADEFDAVDIAVKLISIGFAGKYRAITDQALNATLIRKEIRSLSPALDFDVLQISMPPTDANTLPSHSSIDE